MKKQVHWWQNAALALSLGIFPAIMVPLQTYIGNKSAFGFGTCELLCEALPVTFAIVLASFVLFYVSDRFAGRWLQVVAAAVLVCMYLETGILSLGLPSLNGEVMSILGNPWRKIIDTGVLAITFFGMLVFGRYIKGYIGWIAVVVLIMTGASLFDVKDAEKYDLERSPLVSGYCPRYDVAMSVRYSPERNILMFVLDSTPASLADDVMRANPELAPHFPGFTSYPKNLAMSEKTIRGLPGLMTGKPLTKDISTGAYTETIYGSDSFLFPYFKDNIPIYFSPDIFSYGFTNRRLGDWTELGKNLHDTGPVFHRNSKVMPYLTLLDLVKFRLVPYQFKPRALLAALAKVSASKISDNPVNEVCLYPILRKADVSAEKKTALGVFHTRGVHPPVYCDRYGKRLPCPRSDREILDDACYSVLKMLGEMFDELRERGIYDKSFIVVAADHGCILMKSNDEMHGAESSILWTKPIGEKKPFAFSDLPTSNSRVHDLMLAVKDRDLSQKDIDDILYVKERHFMAKHGLRWWSFGRRLYFYEWIYDENGKLVSCANLGMFKSN